MDLKNVFCSKKTFGNFPCNLKKNRKFLVWKYPKIPLPPAIDLAFIHNWLSCNLKHNFFPYPAAVIILICVSSSIKLKKCSIFFVNPSALDFFNSNYFETHLQEEKKNRHEMVQNKKKGRGIDTLSLFIFWCSVICCLIPFLQFHGSLFFSCRFFFRNSESYWNKCGTTRGRKLYGWWKKM